MASSFLAITSSAISSVACEPIRWAPRSSPYLASKTSLTKPSVSSDARARPLNWNGNLPMRTSWPASRAAFSVRPDAGDAGIGVGAAGDVRVVDRAIGEAAEPLDAADRLVVRHVGQPGRADHVADRVDSRHAGDVAVLGVGLDVVLDDLHLERRRRTSPSTLPSTPMATSIIVGLDDRLALGRLDLGLDPLVGLLELGRLGAGVGSSARAW